MRVNSLVATDDQRLYFADIGAPINIPAAPSPEVLELIEKIEDGEIEPVILVLPDGMLEMSVPNVRMYTALSFLRWSLIKVKAVTRDGKVYGGALPGRRNRAWAVARPPREDMGPPEPPDYPPDEEEEEEEP